MTSSNSVSSSSSRNPWAGTTPNSPPGEAKAPTPVAILLATTPPALEQNGSTPPQGEQGGSGLTAYLIIAPDPEPMDQTTSAPDNPSSPLVVDLCSPHPVVESRSSPPVVPAPNDSIAPATGTLTEPSTNTPREIPANPGPLRGQEQTEDYHNIDLKDFLDLDGPIAPMTTEEWDEVDKMLEDDKTWSVTRSKMRLD